MVAQVGVHPEVLLTGGVALNEGVVAGLEEALGVRLHHTEHPQLVGAVGAAIVACEKAAHRG
jgi:activator of 2-hydroxyglutaryl-CoA dehydratase